jgi:hypothetical protein
MRVGGLILGEEQLAAPAVGVAGREALQVGERELRLTVDLVGRREVRGVGEGADRLGRDAQELGCLPEIDCPLARALGDRSPSCSIGARALLRRRR